MITDADIAYFAEGQCHALALVVLTHLRLAGHTPRLVASWLDPRGFAALDEIEGGVLEEGDPPPVTQVEHILVVDDEAAIDISGRTPLRQMDEYLFHSIIGWADADMPLLRHTVVDLAWVEDLSRQGWLVPDYDRANQVLSDVLGTVNTDYTEEMLQ